MRRMIKNAYICNMKFRRFICGLCLLFVLPLHAVNLLIEAEHFSQKGGWCVDQQFMDLMGSPYLIAHGMGVPVPDASTVISIPESGEYTVYVRTYNWTSPWHKGKGPGAFALQLGKQKLKTIVGQDGDKWMWQSAGKVRLAKGTTTLTLKDLTGFDGRCDAIFLTNTPGELPPAHDKLTVLPDVKDAGHYDLVVVGAGMAGMCAAVSAARLGMKVALLNDRPILGGNNSSEIRVHLGGMIEVEPYPELGGTLKEFAPVKQGNAQPAENYMDARKMDWIKAEKNVHLFTNQRAFYINKENNKITSIITQHIETGEQSIFHAPLFVDCTGDGTIGYLAGADWRMGREASDEFGESRGQEKADEMTMGTSVQWYSNEDSKPSTFPAFNYGVTFNQQNAEHVTMGEWTWETGMNKNQITDFEQIRDYGMLVIYANWSYLKNAPETRKEYAHRKLGWVAYIAGKRESRRLMGDYILSQQDLEKNIEHEDGSAITTWSCDLHEPDPANTANFPGQEFKATTKHLVIYPTTIPYRCLYSRNIENLFMAGRNISQTHVALGATRVMRTTAMMGEVVGMAASICKKYSILPRGVYYYHLPELKNLMKAGVNVKGLPNNQNYNEGGHLEKRPHLSS